MMRMVVILRLVMMVVVVVLAMAVTIRLQRLRVGNLIGLQQIGRRRRRWWLQKVIHFD